MPSFYTPHLIPGMKKICIEGDEYHHIVNVFRKKENDEILLSNGKGLMSRAKIEAVSKKSLTAVTISSDYREKSKPCIAVGFSLLRNKNDHIVIEKLSELGVSEFFPFIGQRSVRAVSNNTVDKFIKISVAACKQCDNPYLPVINRVVKLERLIETLQNDDYQVLAAQEREVDRLISDLFVPPFPDKVALLFGPEGGFSEEEISFLESRTIKGVTLGNHILRAETAAISGVSQLILTILKYRPDFF